MTRCLLAGPLALAILGSSGCGTLGNLASPNPEPYGGLRYVGKPPWMSGHSASQGGLGAVLGEEVDLILTLIGDTLTLPLVPFLPHNPLIGNGPFPRSGGTEGQETPGLPPDVSLGRPRPVEVKLMDLPVR
jgi:uncharacterized protein YceK